MHGDGVVDGQLRHLLQKRVPLLAGVGKDFDVIRPDVLEVLRQLVLHALYERHDRDDRRHPDHHAENGQHRAHFVGPDGAEGDLKVL